MEINTKNKTVKQGKMSGKIRLFVMLVLVVSCALLVSGCGKKYESSSLENRDYAITIKIETDSADSYSFSFEVADLTEYSGDSERALMTEEFGCQAQTLNDAMQLYYDENNRQLDLGHLQEIILTEQPMQQVFKDVIYEMSNMPFIAKSVEVIYEGQGENSDYSAEDNDDKIILRELIKEVYAGEES